MLCLLQKEVSLSHNRNVANHGNTRESHNWQSSSQNQNREFQTDEEVISLNLHPWRSSQELPLIDCSQFPLNNTSTSPSTSHTGTQGTSPGKSKRRRSQTINFMYMNQACRKYFDCGSIILFKLLS